jgi:uncharacterized membrane protein YcaP (DUF421 family)
MWTKEWHDGREDAMELVTIALRTVLMYAVILISMRLMGKREIGKLSIFDLIISILIAEIAVFVIEDVKKPVLESLLPVVILVGIQILSAHMSLRSKRFRDLLEGRPSILIKNGKLNRKEMKRQRYNLDDLMVQLRENGIRSVADVEFAILETSGKLSVFEKEQGQDQKQTKDKNPPFRYEGLPVPLIMDGQVQEENLQKIGKNRFWLRNALKERGISNIREVFLCTYDHKGRLFIDRKKE